MTDTYEPQATDDPVHPPQVHADAALIDTDEPYPPPLDQLLTLGDAWEEHPDVDARREALGLTQAHVPDLVRMARDRRLYESDVPEVWGPAHALLALADLDFRPWLGDLVRLFDIEDDWLSSQLPAILSHAGEAAVEPLTASLNDQTRWVFARMSAGTTLVEVAQRFPELRDRVVAILTRTLAQAADQDEDLNGMLVSDLIDLNATEALPIVRQAFEIDKVDESFAGDWGTIQRAFGVEPDPKDPLVRRSKKRWDAQRAHNRAMVRGITLAKRSSATYAGEQRKKKAKAKRKSAAASRKANKKRK